MSLIALNGDDFEALFAELQARLLQTRPVHIGEWQSQKIDEHPMRRMRELLNVSFEMALPSDPDALAELTGAHLPWAEDHFRERVSGKPLNPPPSEAWWPFAQQVNRDHKSEEDGKFSHTYPERMWPKFANVETEDWGGHPYPTYMNRGIRFDYGDLEDVVKLLAKSPNTRQAYLPIWFPEDTGAVHGKRVPCTLGYHFQLRNHRLDITYYIRSCDLVRHFQDDVYMAGRLAQWVADKLNTTIWDDVVPLEPLEQTVLLGSLYMHIANLHVFEGDTAMMAYRHSKGLSWNIA